jgi:hypothetical protein
MSITPAGHWHASPFLKQWLANFLCGYTKSTSCICS